MENKMIDVGAVRNYVEALKAFENVVDEFYFALAEVPEGLWAYQRKSLMDLTLVRWLIISEIDKQLVEVEKDLDVNAE